MSRGGAPQADSSETLSGLLAAAKAKPAAPSPAAPAKPAPERPLPWYKRLLGGKKGKGQPEPTWVAPQEPTKWSFGQPLDAVPLLDGVPEILTHLRRVLWERRGQVSEGIFRVSPAASDLKAHRALVEAGQFDELRDVDCVAQLIKLWFKELPQSILAPQLAPIVDGLAQDGATCAQLVRQMPEVNQRVVEWLLQLFTDICRHETENRMTATSLTIVFSPNLLDPPGGIDPMTALELNKRVVRFLERLFDFWNQHNGGLGPRGPAQERI